MRDYQDAAHLAVVLNQADIQEILLGEMKTAALRLVTALFEQDVERLCGKPFSHKESHQFRRGGSEPTSVVVSGAKHKIRRPRVRGQNGEVSLPSYSTLRSGDILDSRMQAHMMHGVSTRSYERLIEEYSDRFGVSRSSVSRAFGRTSQKDLDLMNTRDLHEYPFVAIMIDGIEFADHCLVVALGITKDGQKVVLGVRDGATENSEVVCDLLANIKERGFKPYCSRLLACLDGSKALRSAVIKHYGHRVLIQRCYLHKLRNIQSYLPEKYHEELKRRIRIIMGLTSYADAQVQLHKLQGWLDSIHSQAASSLKEVGEELLTLHRLGVQGNLRRSLSSTNLIESLFSVVRQKCSRVKNWDSSPNARLRWVASAALYHEKRMKRVMGQCHMQALIDSLNIVETTAAVG